MHHLLSFLYRPESVLRSVRVHTAHAGYFGRHAKKKKQVRRLSGRTQNSIGGRSLSSSVIGRLLHID